MRRAILDISGNRAAKKWAGRELRGRVLWDFAHPLFAWSPRPLWAWRRFLLRMFGATIGSGVHIYPSVRIAVPWNLRIGNDVGIGYWVILYSLGPIIVGERATISQGVHLCAGTHDYVNPQLPLLKKSIQIGSEAWICADAFVGPGVKIGARTIVAYNREE